MWGSYRSFCVQSLWWHLTLSWQFWVTQTDSTGSGQCLVWPWAQLNQLEPIRTQLKSESNWWSKSKPDRNRRPLFQKTSDFIGEHYSQRMRFNFLQNRFRKLRIWPKKEVRVLPCTRYKQYLAWNTLLCHKCLDEILLPQSLIRVPEGDCLASPCRMMHTCKTKQKHALGSQVIMVGSGGVGKSALTLQV